MSVNAYELLALCMRYVFAALMVLIVLRAWRITLIDGQRATRLRHLSPETGIIGEFLVVDGNERSKTGMHYPVTLEGTIGSGRGCDIRLRSSSVRHRHAIFQMTADGLFIRSHGRITIRDGVGRRVRNITLNDGDYVTIGSVRLMLILSGAETRPEETGKHIPHAPVRPAPAVEPGISRNDDSIFDVAEEPIVHAPNRSGSQPSRQRVQQRRPRPDLHNWHGRIDSYNTFDRESYSPYDEYQSDTDEYYDDHEFNTPDDNEHDDVFYDFDEYDDC